MVQIDLRFRLPLKLSSQCLLNDQLSSSPVVAGWNYWPLFKPGGGRVARHRRLEQSATCGKHQREDELSSSTDIMGCDNAVSHDSCGSFVLGRALTSECAAYLRACSETRRMKLDKTKSALARSRSDGRRTRYWLRAWLLRGGAGFPGQENDESVIDPNEPLPSLSCGWTPTDNGRAINVGWRRRVLRLHGVAALYYRAFHRAVGLQDQWSRCVGRRMAR